MHQFLIHQKGDHVGVATSNIEANTVVVGVYMDDNSTIELVVKGNVPLGHKIAIEQLGPNAKVMKYGIQVGFTPQGFEIGDYVHIHNMKTARW